MKKKIVSALLAALIGILGTANAQVFSTLQEKTRLYDTSAAGITKMLLPKGARVELIEESERRVLIRLGPLGGWIDKNAVSEEDLEILRYENEQDRTNGEEENGIQAGTDPEDVSDQSQTDETDGSEENGGLTENTADETGENVIPYEDEALNEPDPDEPSETDIEDTATAEEGTVGLKLNDHGEEVRELQEALVALGYKIGRADGYYGKKTRSAVISLQRRYGILSDGIAGEETLKLIRALTDEEHGPVYEAPLQYSYTMRKGKKGRSVLALQQALEELGYLSGELVSGRYGDSTVEAVKAFQQEAGLDPDGIAGERTVNLISSMLLAQRLSRESGE